MWPTKKLKNVQHVKRQNQQQNQQQSFINTAELATAILATVKNVPAKKTAPPGHRTKHEILKGIAHEDSNTTLKTETKFVRNNENTIIEIRKK